MMKVQIIIFAIACIFILLALYHLAAARRNLGQSDDASRITVRVRKRLGLVFLLVGAGLFGYYWLVF
jgi:multisubunit Na+/H+ antiporter MnhB subunit